jgi:hypothetical protein
MPCDTLRLRAYHAALGLIDDTYTLTRAFPIGEQPGLGDELRRTAIALALEIAEGSHARARTLCAATAIAIRAAGPRTGVSGERQRQYVQRLAGVSRTLGGLRRETGRPS